jgi:hypothetical protein
MSKTMEDGTHQNVRSVAAPPALGEVARAVSREAVRASDRGRPLRPSPVPFGDLHQPALTVARRGLTDRLGASSIGRSAAFASCVVALEQAFLVHLAALTTDALYGEFAKARPFGLVMLEVDDAGTAHYDAGTAHFDAFVHRHLADGFRELWSAHPVLARLTVMAIGRWIDATAALLERTEVGGGPECHLDDLARSASPTAQHRWSAINTDGMRPSSAVAGSASGTQGTPEVRVRPAMAQLARGRVL